MSPITRYFNEEKIQCIIGIIIAIVSIGTALYLLYRFKNPLYAGIAYSFIAISIILLTICANVVMRSPKDIRRVEQMIQNDISKIRTEEIPRMEKVLKTFSIVIWVEIICFFSGLLVSIMMTSSSLWKGVGIGLLVQAAMLFVFDFIAQNRGKTYLEFLRTLN